MASANLDVPGAQLFYEGSGSGPLLILIPGASGTGESFRPLIPHLISHYRVVIYDRRGFSRSVLSGPQDEARRLATDADDVRRLIEHVSDQPAIVFGSSSGAIVALEVLTRYPECVQTVVAHEPPAVTLLPDAARWLAFFEEENKHMALSTVTPPPTTPCPLHGKLLRPSPPGPSWYTALGNTIRLGRDPLRFVRELRERYGDLITLPTIAGPFTLVLHPDGVRHVVQEHHTNYRKGNVYQVLSLTLGKGLLTNDGDSWLAQRRLIQPIFHRSRIAAFGQLMTEQATSWIENVTLDPREPLDVFQEMSGLTLSIVCQALFGADMLPYKQRVFAASGTINHLEARAFYLPWLLTLPTPQRRRLDEAKATLDAIVDMLIAGRRSHSTTTNALCWTLMLLAQHPDCEARLREEYTRVLGGRVPQIEDLPQLPFGRMVLEESMRLYPPAWLFARSSIDEDEISGYRIPKGASVLLFPSTTHRHPDFWEQPDVFDPGRFTAERSIGRHRFAYFPFGGGPRVCIGNQFALTEAQLILATILPRCQFRFLPEVTLAPSPLITLRPRDKLRMTIARI